MLTSADVQTRLRDIPFTPFRIVTSGGTTHDVYHPDMVIVGRRFIVVGTPSTEDPSSAELVTRISMLHIAELCDIPPVRA
jgi:hypothetical protein